jgi:hypothetical protein
MASSTNPRKQMQARPAWARWSADHLLKARLCDLGLRLAGTVIETRIQALNSELSRRGLRFRPHFWLSDEWFSPSDVPGVAIPFYLAHPRLVRLESNQMLEAEGASLARCMRILRHETGHALEHAYRLRRRRRWQQLFGSSSQPYPLIYRPRPFSKRFVHHLDAWYAQSHPDEDFAETFAVWLTPRAAWRQRYAGWPALRKLEYVDELMTEIADRPAVVRTRRQVDPVSRLRKTLGEHYMERRLHYGIDAPNPYDRHLQRLFSSEPGHAHREAASVFLRSVRSEIVESVCSWTGQSAYTVEQIVKEMMARCRKLRLRMRPGRARAREGLVALLTMETVYELQRGRMRLTL